MTLVEYPDRDLMTLRLADTLASELADALRRHDRATFCVPGGTTPGPIFDVLSEQALDWGRVTVLLSDERWVPETSDRSNARLLRDRLLVARARAARFVPYYRPGQSPARAAAALCEDLAPHLPISVLLLGMGADMHTASLFPGAEGLAAALDARAPALMALRAGGDGAERRIGLTVPALDGAVRRHLAITGPEKRAALERAANVPVLQAPVRAVLGGATIHWAA